MKIEKSDYIFLKFLIAGLSAMLNLNLGICF